MKLNFLVFFIVFGISTKILAQVGIGTTSPDSSSVLDITSTDKGVLVPRVNLTNVTNATTPVASPATGLLVWNTNATVTGGSGEGFYFFDGSMWISLGNNASFPTKIDDLSDGKSDSDGTQDGSSIFLGIGAGANDDSSDNQNVGVGAYSLFSNTTGYHNVAIGRAALINNTTGFLNTAVGYASMNFQPVNGRYNTALGALTLNLLVNAQYNTAIGYRALYNNNGGNNTAVGNESMFFTDNGGLNTAMGNQSLYSNTSGARNTVLGSRALYSNDTGSDNIAIGHNAGYFETGSNTLYIENSNTTLPLIYGEFDNDLLRINGTLDINNAYQFPTTDGTANQLLQTDGSGTVSWVDVATIANSDHDFYEEGTTTAPNDINDDKYTMGNLAIGKNIADYPLDITTSSFVNRLLNLEASPSGMSSIGVYANLGNYSGSQYGGQFILNGNNATSKEGLLLDFDSYGSSSMHIGVKTEIDNNSFSDNYGAYTVVNTNFGDNYGVKNELTTNTSGSQYGVDNILSTSTGLIKGLYNRLQGGSTVYGVQNEFWLLSSPATINYGTKNNFYSSSASIGRYGTHNTFEGNGANLYNYGTYNSFVDSSPQTIRGNLGIYNNFRNSVVADYQKGMYNIFEWQAAGDLIGLHNEFVISSGNPVGNDEIIGVFNESFGTSGSNNTHFGIKNELSGQGDTYGIYNNIFSNLVAYGSYNFVRGTGVTYGVYSDVISDGDDFSGYFLGPVAVGTTTADTYTLPLSRGANGQIMQTDGAGTVSWVDDPSPSLWTRSGGILNLTNTTDDITFTSDQTSITFAASNGTPQPMLYMFSGGTANSNKMVISHSAAFSNYGLLYNDVDDSFQFLRAGTNVVEIDLFGTNEVLTVNGDIGVNGDIITDTATYPDYVFEYYYEGTSKIKSNYKMMSLDTLEDFVKSEKHLPNVKSFSEVEKEGMTINLGNMTVTNLEKIEEAFLYILELKKENDKLKKQLETQQKEINSIKELLKE